MTQVTKDQIRDALSSMPPNEFLLDSDVGMWFELHCDTIRDAMKAHLVAIKGE